MSLTSSTQLTNYTSELPRRANSLVQSSRSVADCRRLCVTLKPRDLVDGPGSALHLLAAQIAKPLLPRDLRRFNKGDAPWQYTRPQCVFYSQKHGYGEV